MILGQLRIWARPATYAALGGFHTKSNNPNPPYFYLIFVGIIDGFVAEYSFFGGYSLE